MLYMKAESESLQPYCHGVGNIQTKKHRSRHDHNIHIVNSAVQLQSRDSSERCSVFTNSVVNKSLNAGINQGYQSPDSHI